MASLYSGRGASMKNRRGGLRSHTETALTQMRRRIGIAFLDDTLRKVVLDTLKKTGGDVRTAALLLGVGNTTIYRYLERWNTTKAIR